MKENEKAVLSACMKDPDVIRVLAPTLNMVDFQVYSHRLLWACYLDLYSKRERCTFLAATNWLDRRKRLDDVGLEYLAEIRDYLETIGVESTAEASEWADQIAEASERRGLIDVAEEIKKSADSDSSLDNVFADAAARLQTVRRHKDVGFKPLSNVEDDLTELAEDWFAGRTAGAMSTGFPSLDDVLGGGLRPRRLYVLGARPAMGKTLFAWAIAKNVAEGLKEKNDGGVVAFVSLEMSSEELAMRAASSGALVENRDLMAGMVKDPAVKERWLAELREIGRLPIRVDDTDSLTSSMIRFRVEMLDALSKVEFVVIDFAELVGDKGEAEELRVSGIFRAAKSLAKGLNIPVMLLSQLSREVDKTENKLPALRHLRYAGSAEATADYVMFCMPPDESVITQRGEVPIVQVQVGDKVLTHRQRWQAVTELMRRSYAGDLVGLRPVYSENPVWLTPEHPVLMSPDGKTVCWREAGELNAGDLVATPAHALESIPAHALAEVARVSEANAVNIGKRSDALRNEIEAWMLDDPDFWKMVGFWLAEGSATEGVSRVDFAFGKGEDALVTEVEVAVNRLFGVALHRQKRELEVWFTSGACAQFLRTWFKSNGKKVLPWWIDLVRVDCLREMLRGLFLGDAYIVPSGLRATLGNGSLELLSAVQRLLLRLEIHGGIRLMQRERDNHVIKGKRCRTSPVYGLDAGKLMTDFVFRSVLYGRRGARGRRGSGAHTGLLFSGGYALLPLRAVERKWYEGTVHNMSVEGDESYCSRLLAVHNCYDPYRYAEMGDTVMPAQGTTLSENVWFLLVEKARYGRPGVVTFEFDRPHLVLKDRNVRVEAMAQTDDEVF